MEFLRQWQGSRRVVGLMVSVALHVLVLALVIGVQLPRTRYDLKRGEPLIVELPKGDDSPPPGRGGAPEPPPAATRATPAPPAPVPRAPAAPSVPRIAARSAPRPAEPARPSPPQAEPRPAPQAEPAARAPSAVAAKPAEPAPAPPAPQPAASESVPTTEPQSVEPTPAQPQPAQPQRQIASLPQPSGPAERATPNILTALRRGAGGAGGSGQGHAGIEGEPIALDSTDPRYSDYLEQVRRRIKDKWGYPCEKNEQTKVCEYRSTQLLVEFGILKNGELAFVTLRRTSGHQIYDDYALNAVKLASPFPPIPDSFSKTGVPIQASFHYVLQSSLTNILR